MIWGGPGGTFRREFFFPGTASFKIFFFPEKDRENFFFSISSGPPPQIINGRPLKDG